MTILNRLRRNPFWLWIAFLAGCVAAGLFAGLLIFTQGLGVTGLSDGVPWGLWITLDLSCIALSAGAFSLSVLTYLLGRENFKPLARIAVFIGAGGF